MTDPASVRSAPIRIAIVGGGISGLTAAYRLRKLLGADIELDLYEASDRLGGTLRSTAVAGVAVDVGAEAFVVRRPEVLDLATELGIAHRIVKPAGKQPALLAGGALVELPWPTLMGIPASADAVRGIADPADVARIDAEPSVPLSWRSGGDISIGALVRDRFGSSIVDRSVDPLLGGVYSARADDISLRAALPQLAAKLDAGAASLSDAVAGLIGNPLPGPVFGTFDGGYQMLTDALAAAATLTNRYATAISAVGNRDGRWVVAGTGTDATQYEAVVLAVPAVIAARLVPGPLAGPLSGIDTSGSVLVVLAIEPGATLPDKSGILVATGEALQAKAFTFTTNKWPHLADGMQLVRASFGRHGESLQQTPDQQLIDRAAADLSTVCGLAGLPGPAVADAAVQRWPNGLPHYAPGHVERVEEIDDATPNRLALAGASYSGVGVPACIARADAAARKIVADLAGR